MTSLHLPGKFTANVLRGLWRMSKKPNHYTQAGSHWVAFKGITPNFLFAKFCCAQKVLFYTHTETKILTPKNVFFLTNLET